MNKGRGDQTGYRYHAARQKITGVPVNMQQAQCHRFPGKLDVRQAKERQERPEEEQSIGVQRENVPPEK
jgi:hypothetical protein